MRDTRTLGALLAICTAPSCLGAAEVQYKFEADMLGHGSNIGVDTIYLSGEIKAGDSKVISDLIHQHDIPHSSNLYAIQAMLVLDSPGGNVREAIEIARLVDQYGFATYIGAEDECLSACAFVFMAGSLLPYENMGNTNTRMLHVDGDLGFHAPFLDLLGRGMGQSDRSDAIQFNYSDVANMVDRTISETSNVISDLVAIREDAIPMSLLSSLLLTPSNEYERVDTVEEAIEWDIEIVGTLREPVSFSGAVWQCYNSLSTDKHSDILSSPEFIETCLTPRGPDHPDYEGQADPEFGDFRRFRGVDCNNGAYSQNHQENGNTFLIEGNLNALDWEEGRISVTPWGAPFCSVYPPKQIGGSWCVDLQNCGAKTSVMNFSPSTLIQDLPRDPNYVPRLEGDF